MSTMDDERARERDARGIDDPDHDEMQEVEGGFVNAVTPSDDEMQEVEGGFVNAVTPSFRDTHAGRARPELADMMDRSPAVAALAKMADARRTDAPRSETELREDVREDMQRDVDAALERMRDIYVAAARWMAIEELIMQADGEVVLELVESTPHKIGERTPRSEARAIRAFFAEAIGEGDVKRQLAEFADGVLAAIAIENERRRAERKRRAASPISEIDRA
jgi:hypothetical protein